VPGLQNYAPNFSIPTSAFKRDIDPYAQILPMLLQGQQAAEQNRKQQLISGMFKNNPELNTLAQVDPRAAIKAWQDQQSQAPAFMSPGGQVSPTQQPGYQPFGNVDRTDLMKTMASQQEKGATLEERQKDSEMNRQLRISAQAIQQALAQGKHDEALAKLEEVRAAIKQRAADAAAARKLKAESENAKYPVQNIFRKFTGRGPVVSVPDDQSGGWTAADEARLKELQSK
jgi:hypothetical protein